MPKIFISYRRDEIIASALLHSIYLKLIEQFGKDNVFIDIDSIPLGVDFKKYIFNEIEKCDILLAVIGDQWLDLLKHHKNTANDFVRLEIEAAIARDILIIPILLADAKMPGESDLPISIRPLAYRNGINVCHSSNFSADINYLISQIKRIDETIISNRQPVTLEQVYNMLNELLSEHEWKEADYLTGRIMLALANRQDEGWLDGPSVKRCPNKDIAIIDNLWIKHSNGRFGYSVQVDIYKKITSSSKYSQKQWEQFATCVGWLKKGRWLSYGEMSFINNAPHGHLPDGFVAVQYEDGTVVREWVLAFLEQNRSFAPRDF